MANLITEIFDRQAVLDNLKQLQDLINSEMQKIVDGMPKIDNSTFTQLAEQIKAITQATQTSIQIDREKAKVTDELGKLYAQYDKAIEQNNALTNERGHVIAKELANEKEQIKQQKQIIELERTRENTLANFNELINKQAQSEGELRKQQTELIKASQSLRITNAEENKLREQIIAKINANKEALKGMTDEVSKQRDNVGNYKSAWDAFTNGQINLKQAMKEVKEEMAGLEVVIANGGKLTKEQEIRYHDLNNAMGNLADIQGDMSARAKILSDDYRDVTFALEGMKLGVNVMTSLNATIALVGGSNEKLQRTLTKVASAMQIVNTLSQIQKQLNKDSIIRVNLRIIREKFLAQQERINAQSTLAMAGAETIAQKASIGLATGIRSVGAAIKSVPVVGWLAAAVTALTTILALINDANAQEEHGNEILEDRQRNLGEIISKHQTIIEKIKEENEKFREMVYRAKQGTYQFDQVIDRLSQVSGLSDEYLTSLSDDERYNVTEIFNELTLLQEQLNSAMETESELLEVSKEDTKKYTQYQRAVKETHRLENLVLIQQQKIAEINKKQWEWKKKQQDLADKEKTEAKAKAEREKRNAENARKAKEEADRLAKEEEERRKRQIEYEQSIARSDKATFEYRILSTKEHTEARKQLEIEYNNWQLRQQKLALKDQLDVQKITREEYDATLKLLNKQYSDNEKKIIKDFNDYQIKVQHDAFLANLQNLADYAAELKVQREKELQDFEEFMQKTQSVLNSSISSAREVFSTLYDEQTIAIENQTSAMELNYDRRKNLIEQTITDEEEKNKKLALLDAERLDAQESNQRKQAELERRKAIFDNAISGANATASAIEAMGKLLKSQAFSLPTFLTAMASGISAVVTITSLLKSIASIPAYEKGGLAKENTPFIAGEKGLEIGIGQKTGKMYAFANMGIYKAPEPVNIKNAQQTQRIINNEYNKDVTLANVVSVKVVNNKRIEKYFKI